MPEPRRRRRIVVLNQKGGVGKTTLVVHLAYAAAKAGASVLVVDLDSQCNATATLAGYISTDEETSSVQLFTAGSALDIKPLVAERGIHLLNATQNIDWIDSQFSIEDAFSRAPLVQALPYDVVIFDTPPAVGLRHLAPLAWCEMAIIPVEPSAYSLDGVATTITTIRAAQAGNPSLTYELVINKHVASSASHRAIADELDRIAHIRFPYLTLRVAITNALTARVPVWQWKAADPALRSTWLNLCTELIS